ncbi:MAG: hypothetical protein GXO71_03850 [Caldiserica bacterium]|nr:hypothetical protein [Caldisericota bacterium]
MVWLEFILASGIVIFAGTKLAYVGDKIGEAMGWERSWVGLLLLSFSTSLPELFTSVSAAGVLHQPDLALGNNLGSVAFNLLIISVLDLMEKGSFTHRLNPKLILSGVVTLLIILVFAGFIIHPLPWGFLGVGLDTFLIFILFLFAMRFTFLHQHKGIPGNNSLPGNREDGFLRWWVFYFFLALLILGGGLWLANVGERISELTGISRSFVGALFLAFATSLPELSVTISCVRMGLPDMAVGNILGANLQNLAIPFYADIFFRSGYLLAFTSPVQIITLITGGVLTCILLLGIIYRSQRHFLRMGWDSIFMILVYLGGMYLVFRNPGGR